jgi:hypothetical protein
MGFGWGNIFIVIGSLVVFFAGLQLARLIKDLITVVLDGVQIDSLLDSLKVTEFLKRGGVRMSVAELISVFFYWLFVLGLLVAFLRLVGVDQTGIDAAREVVTRFIPDVMLAIFIFIFSSLVGAFVGRLAALIAASFNYVNVSLIEKFAKYSIVFFGIYYAVGKLNVLPSNLDFALEKAVIFGTALAVALGAQRWAGETFQNLFEQDSDNDALPPTKLKKK